MWPYVPNFLDVLLLTSDVVRINLNKSYTYREKDLLDFTGSVAIGMLLRLCNTILGDGRTMLSQYSSNL